jgi:predicted DNA-binding protein (UPF0251 family)
MPRPRKLRTVCDVPHDSLFGPKGRCIDEKNIVIMSVDEYETIRLIDHENMTQEECAVQMNIARTTVTSIYHEARKKLASVIVLSAFLKVEGGDYVLCSGNHHHCNRQGCNRQHRLRGGDSIDR